MGENSKMKFWQMAFLLVIYVFCFIYNIVLDFSFDGKLDQPSNMPLFILMIIMGFGTIWYYGFARKAHMYVR